MNNTLLEATGCFWYWDFLSDLNQNIMANLKNYKLLLTTAWCIVLASLITIFVTLIP